MNQPSEPAIGSGSLCPRAASGFDDYLIMPTEFKVGEMLFAIVK
jgi:hypothetical protein